MSLASPSSEVSMKVIQNLVDLEVLTAILPDMGGEETRCVGFVACGDGDQFPEKFDHLARVCGTRRIHPVTCNGGAILMSSLLGQQAETARPFLLAQLAELIELKGSREIVLSAHYPCGKAHRHGLCVLSQINGLLEAKMLIRTEFENKVPKLVLRCLFHIARPDGTRRTYFVNRNKFTPINIQIISHRALPELAKAGVGESPEQVVV